MRASYDEVTYFLYQEAALLDQKRFEEWLDLLDDSLIYRMPIRVTTDSNEAPDVVDEMTFFDETKRSLTTRVERLRTSSGWAENPATRTRHFISNIMIEPDSTEDNLTVRSYFLVLRSYRDRIDVEQIFGERVDVLRRIDGKLKLQTRTIYPDQSVLTMLNLSIFL